jgi:hypothetical protein
MSALALLLNATPADVSEKAFEFAADMTKQLISLSTGTIAITATFLRNVATMRPVRRSLLFVSWGLLLVSTVAGLGVLSALTGQLVARGSGGCELGPGCPNVRFFSILQIGLFILGLTSIAGFGYTSKSPDSNTTDRDRDQT